LTSIGLTVLAACAESGDREGRKVETSGRAAIDPGALPEDVLAVVRASQPALRISEAEYEQRDGNDYYDVGGTLPDGLELELDLTRVDGVWTVVETQRDVPMEAVPTRVGDVLRRDFPEWRSERIIESDQGSGVVIYEFFGSTGPDESTKVEIKWEQGNAELLKDEWLH
jgi:hypothetical protein